MLNGVTLLLMEHGAKLNRCREMCIDLPKIGVLCPPEMHWLTFDYYHRIHTVHFY